MLNGLASRTLRRVTHALARRSADERGSVLVLASISLVVVIGSTALAVDLGHTVTSNRDFQAVADLAALDAVRAIGDRKNQANGLSTDQHALKLARESATRNDFDWNNAAAGQSLALLLGKVDPNTRLFTQKCDGAGLPAGCVSDATQINAVKVTVTGRVDWSFMPGGRNYSASAVAIDEDLMGMSLGSFLARLDTSKSAILNPLLSNLLGSSLTLDLVSYQGLANANVTLAELGTELGLTAGGVDEILAADVTLVDLLNASAAALTKRGDVVSLAAVSPLGTLAAATNSNLDLKLGDLFEVVQGGGDAALAAETNVLQLVQMAAQVADGDNAINLNLGVSIPPGLYSTTVNLAIIEKPKIIIGPARLDASGNWVSTLRSSQVRAQLDVEVGSLLGGIVHLPIFVEAGSAEASVTAINCATPIDSSTVNVHVEPQTARASIGFVASPAVNPVVIQDATLLHVAGLVRVTGRVDVPLNGAESDLVFDGPWDWNNTQTAGSTTLGAAAALNTNLSTSNLTVTALGLPLLVPANLSATIVSMLRPVLLGLDNALIDPLLSSLGISLGGGDVTIFDLRCSHRTLVN